MILREDLEAREEVILSPYATRSAQSKGREQTEEECRYRTLFQRDRDRIIHSKAFRRLMHKTQVFLAPEGDHFRTRLTHTIEVSQIARTIARSLALNEDLTEAIAMGHDLGHTPFGHSGEEFLNQRHPGGFCHNVQSLHVVRHLEKTDDRWGMNLTWEVRDGILNHTGDQMPMTPEGQIVRLSDRIAYINHDIDDALRSNVIREKDLPKDCISALGGSRRDRINALVNDVVTTSDSCATVGMSLEKTHYMDKLRTFMFENIYHNPKVKKAEELEKIHGMIRLLYDHFETYPKKLPAEQRTMIPKFGIQEVVKDYIAGMTDRYAVNLFKELYIPKSWR